MRMCEKNKRDIWYSYFMGEEEIISGGYFTGEFEEKYTNWFKTKLNYMPVSSYIGNDKFGLYENIDILIIDDEFLFNEDTVFSTYEPDNIKISENYEYRVFKIIKGLNHNMVGLKKRV